MNYFYVLRYFLNSPCVAKSTVGIKKYVELKFYSSFYAFHDYVGKTVQTFYFSETFFTDYYFGRIFGWLLFVIHFDRNDGIE